MINLVKGAECFTDVVDCCSVSCPIRALIIHVHKSATATSVLINSPTSCHKEIFKKKFVTNTVCVSFEARSST